MKPKPLHGFTPADLRAFGAGTKTQWRVPVKPQPSDYVPTTIAPQKMRGEKPKHEKPYFDAYNGGPYWCWWDEYDRQGADWIKCPLGKPGDRLFISEPFAIESFGAGVAQIRYAVDGHRGKSAGNSDTGLPNRLGLVPATRMPAHCARFWCEIVAVRVEKLNAINEADAMAEGIDLGGFRSKTFGIAGYEHRIEFSNAWNARHGAGAWERNDWCWCLTLKKVEGAK